MIFRGDAWLVGEYRTALLAGSEFGADAAGRMTGRPGVIVRVVRGLVGTDAKLLAGSLSS